jgi:hypothetical protein
LTVGVLEDRVMPSVVLGQQPGAPDTAQFHGDAARSGFNQNETVLTPANVANGFGQVWQSPVLDGRLYATPLYLDSILIRGNGNAANFAGDGVQSPSFQNQSLGLVFAATGGGSVYAIAAQDTNGPTGIAAGTIVWKTHLGTAYAGVDGNSIGVLGTPVIDLQAGRIYVVASVTDYLSATSNPLHGTSNFAIFALDIHDGHLIAGFPLFFTQSILDAVNQNNLAGSGVAVAFSASGADQRGALAINADGSTVYVDFACYGASNGGWMAAVATGMSNGLPNGQTPAVVSAYSAIDTTQIVANGGMWGAGGPSIDAAGNVFVSTGDSPSGTGNPLGTWGNSVLEFGPSQTLTLTGVYSPWNYPTQDTIDSDLGGGSPILINLPAGSTTTPELLATGGKQGNGYLLDAGNNLNNPTARPGSPATYPADLTRRPPGTVTPSQDPSLYDTNPATGTRTYYTPNQVGPLSLFGPYNETSASGNTAKARDTPSTAFGPDGTAYVVWAGASKAGIGSSTPVAPSLYLTKVVATPGQPAYLQTVAANTAVMSNPGASMITGDGTSNEILWIVDAGVQRGDSLANFSNGAPTLYAYNLLTMTPIWSSAYTDLNMGGKYNSITAARGDVFVGTNRIQAFGLTTNTEVDNSVTGSGTNQFTYVGSGWQQITGSATMGTYHGTVATTSTQGDFATLNFTGSGIKVYANEMSGYGTATISVDGGNTQTVTLTPANSSPNGQGAGDVLVYTLTGLAAGTHTLKVLNNAASNTISLDKVEVLPAATTHSALMVSMTDGRVVPAAEGVIPYTINYTNAGSVLNATGVNATGVLVTETVPANSSFSAADSTAGWTLTSGTGGAGSTYTFAVGNLAAGVTGSVVFSVKLNTVIPPGTPTITNTASISDNAGDTAGGSRVTPIPPPIETKLVFLQQPPATGGAGVPLSPPIQVAAKDQFGNVFTADSTSTVTLTLNGGTFPGGGNTVTGQITNGIATFNNIIILNAGTYSLTASDGTLAGATSINFTLSGSAKLGIVTQPTQTLAGTAVNPAVKVAVQDVAGNTIAADNSTITLTINTGSFANGSTTLTAQAVNGVATFSNIVINTTGSYTLFATDGLLTGAQTNSFVIVTVASKLVYTRAPANGFAGQAVNPAVTVALEDGFGNIASSDTSTVTVTLGGGTLFGGGTTASVAAVNGVATFSNLVIPAAGTFTLAAADGSLTGTVSDPFSFGTRTLTVIDDNNANNTGGIPTVTYNGSWSQSTTSLANNFGGTLTTDTVGGDNATVSFNGTLITAYLELTPAGGSAKFLLDGGTPVDVNLFSSTPVIAPVYTSSLLTAGSHTLELRVTNGTVALDHFTVGYATPAIFWATPADLTYGSALNLTQLDAFTNVPGTFVYTPGTGTILHAGANQTLSVSYTPTDLANYGPATASVRINVNKATPVITWPEPNGITYGNPLTATQLDATANTPGTFVYTPPLGTMLPTGDNQPLSVAFTPTDTTDYTNASGSTRIDVNQINPVITWSNPANINEGTALSATQLNATADTPGTFSYTPPPGTVLARGNNQPLQVTFTPTDQVNYSIQSKTVSINVVLGPATKVAFLQQPTSTSSGTPISPPVQVAVQNVAGSTITTDTSVVTLTLSGGTFAGGGNTVTAAAVNGVATFNSLAINNNGQYTITASDGSLSSAVSNIFAIGSSAYVNFNIDANDFTSQFATNLSGNPGGTALGWNPAAGVSDNTGGTAGGGVHVSGGTDETAVYTPVSFNLGDGATHTISMFITAAAGLSGGDRQQIGFVTSNTAGLNGGFSFVSARLFGNHAAEFQSGNGSGTAAVSQNNTQPTGAIATGDWLQLILTTKVVASGSFSGTFSVIDYGPTGTGFPVAVLGPVNYSVTGLNTIGTGSVMYGAFRTATGNGGTGLNFDNFAVDQPPFKMAYLQQPTTGTAGVALATPFVVAVEDINGHVVAGDSSTVTLSLNQGTFAGGASTASATAVNGIASFSNLTLNVAGSYVLRANDSNPNLDPGFAPFTITAATASAAAFTQQPPAMAVAGSPISPAVAVAVTDAFGNTVTTSTATVTLTLNGGTFAGGGNTVNTSAVSGVATFGNLVINAIGSYTLTAAATGLSSATSSSFAVTYGVKSVTPTATGVNVRLSGSLDPTVLNLYDQGSQFGPADVMLVGPSGPVRGSLVLTSAAAPAGQFDGFTFIATGGSTAGSVGNSLLPAGSYTLTLNSGATAFKDRTGNLLNGGTNYTTTFTVAAPPAEVLSLSSFVRGAGQAIHLPTDTAAGLPVYLSDATGVGSVNLSFTYDNTILTITGFTPNAGIPGVSATFNTSANGTTTTVTIAVTGTAAFTTAAGPFSLGNFTATVPSTAPYGAKGVLHVSALTVKNTGGTVLPSLGADGLQVAAYVADDHKDRNYGASDITLENRLFLGVVTGFVGTPVAPTFPLVDPQLLGSITGNGNVGGGDITQLNREFLGLTIPNIPAIPTLGTQPPNGIDPRLFIPTTTTAQPGQTITVPVDLEVTDPRGIAAGLASDSLLIRYDPAVLTFQGIQAGSLFANPSAGFGGYATNVSPGLIKALITSAHGTGPLAHGTLGSVALLTFKVSGTATPGRSVLNLEATDGVTATEVVDNAFNRLTLSPAPTNGAGDAADGAITIVSGVRPMPVNRIAASRAPFVVAVAPVFALPATDGPRAVTPPAVERVAALDVLPVEAGKINELEMRNDPTPASVAKYRSILDSFADAGNGDAVELIGLGPRSAFDLVG